MVLGEIGGWRAGRGFWFFAVGNLPEHDEDVTPCVAGHVLDLVAPLVDGVYPVRQVAVLLGGPHGDVFLSFLDLEVDCVPEDGVKSFFCAFSVVSAAGNDGDGEYRRQRCCEYHAPHSFLLRDGFRFGFWPWLVSLGGVVRLWRGRRFWVSA